MAKYGWKLLLLGIFIDHFACWCQIKRVLQWIFFSTKSGKFNVYQTLNSLCKPAIWWEFWGRIWKKNHITSYLFKDLGLIYYIHNQIKLISLSVLINWYFRHILWFVGLCKSLLTKNLKNFPQKTYRLWNDFLRWFWSKSWPVSIAQYIRKLNEILRNVAVFFCMFLMSILNDYFVVVVFFLFVTELLL